MRIKGKITSWNDAKGFGFIEPCAGGKRVFFHVNALSHRNRRPEISQLITYALSEDKQGRPCAVNAVLAGYRVPQQAKPQNGSLSVSVAVVFFVIVAVSVVADELPGLILALYLIASLLSFLMYAGDKAAARKGAWRTQESTLHMLSLAGGWPGALVAQQKLRHKSKKAAFRSVFWGTVLLNCGALVWMYTATGAATLELLISLMR
ncbi:MAG: DUF1294 domain-containing protein [Motiliproteus sp.]